MITDIELLKDISAERVDIAAQQSKLKARLSELDVVERFIRERTNREAQPGQQTLDILPRATDDATPERRAKMGAEKRKVYEALRASANLLAPKVIADQKDLIPSTVRNSLREGAKKGEVYGENGAYGLTEVGLSLLNAVEAAEREEASNENNQNTQVQHVGNAA